MDENIEKLVAKIYKEESAKILAVLTRIFGPQNLDLAEDVLQDAFGKALSNWQENGIPKNPSAWIFKIAKNKAIDFIRSNKTKMNFASDLQHHLESEWSLGQTIENEFSESKIKDDRLRMMFTACHKSISTENRLPFILKALCGFSIPAIARALILTEETVKKRLLRTREKIRSLSFDIPTGDSLQEALDTVHTVIYLLFNEGFHSSDQKRSTNIDFCNEAVALARLLIEEPEFVNKETIGLYSLMHFHMARISSKTNLEGENIPIDLQDRNLWDQELIDTGKLFLKTANDLRSGPTGRFFTEAMIAKLHCEAKTFNDTNWNSIVDHYKDLVSITGSPVAELNLAIAVGYAGDLKKAISKVSRLLETPALKKSHMPSAALAHLFAKLGKEKEALEFYEKSKKLGGTPFEHQLMKEQIDRLLSVKK